jgi:proteasome lid subunit RPN8/RPN11
MGLFRSLTLMCWGVLGCASGLQAPGESDTYGIRDGQVWVRGPWEAIRPSSDADEVIDQLCPAVMRLHRAKEEDYGREYCGVIYSMSDGTYYASHPSPLRDTRMGTVSSRKNCYIPSIVEDARGRSVPLADYHSHPWSPSAMSLEDRFSANQVYSIRLQFDNACLVQKLVPYLNEDRPGELYERRGKHWKLIGLIKVEHKASGVITRVND